MFGKSLIATAFIGYAASFKLPENNDWAELSERDREHELYKWPRWYNGHFNKNRENYTGFLYEKAADFCNEHFQDNYKWCEEHVKD